MSLPFIYISYIQVPIQIKKYMRTPSCTSKILPQTNSNINPKVLRNPFQHCLKRSSIACSHYGYCTTINRVLSATVNRSSFKFLTPPKSLAAIKMKPTSKLLTPTSLQQPVPPQTRVTSRQLGLFRTPAVYHISAKLIKQSRDIPQGS